MKKNIKKTAITLSVCVIALFGMMATGCGADKKTENKESQIINEESSEKNSEEKSDDEENKELNDNSALSNYTELNDLKEEKRTPYLKNLFLNTSNYLDLNGDGVDEKVQYECAFDKEYQYDFSIKLEVNGTDYSYMIGKLAVDNTSDEIEVTFQKPMTDYGYSAYFYDIDENDDYVEIAILDEGLTDETFTHFFRFTGEKLNYIGSIQKLLFRDECYGDGKGSLFTQRNQSLGTSWPTKVKYIINNEGKLEEVKGWKYYADAIDAWQKETHKILKEVEVYIEPKDDAKKITISEADGPVEFYTTDNETWIGLKNEKDEVYYLKMKDTAILENGENIDNILEFVRWFD